MRSSWLAGPSSGPLLYIPRGYRSVRSWGLTWDFLSCPWSSGENNIQIPGSVWLPPFNKNISVIALGCWAPLGRHLRFKVVWSEASSCLEALGPCFGELQWWSWHAGSHSDPSGHWDSCRSQGYPGPQRQHLWRQDLANFPQRNSL